MWVDNIGMDLRDTKRKGTIRKTKICGYNIGMDRRDTKRKGTIRKTKTKTK
jgi:hypothetical protein